MWKTGDPEIATPKRVRTYRPKHSDTSLSREYRINTANKRKKIGLRAVHYNVCEILIPVPSFPKNVPTVSAPPPLVLAGNIAGISNVYVETPSASD